jgi:hypothetical protein
MTNSKLPVIPTMKVAGHTNNAIKKKTGSSNSLPESFVIKAQMALCSMMLISIAKGETPAIIRKILNISRIFCFKVKNTNTAPNKDVTVIIIATLENLKCLLVKIGKVPIINPANSNNSSKMIMIADAISFIMQNQKRMSFIIMVMLLNTPIINNAGKPNTPINTKTGSS